MKRAERIHGFVKQIWSFYVENKRDLPWRDLWDLPEVDRAYRVLVSEVMLQQTQVSRVIIKYKEFLEVFPTIEDLAKASNRDVILAWRGMGYNSRALRLRDCATEIISNAKMRKCVNPKIDIPHTMEELMALPGVGHYTAAAIRNFAFGVPTACLDTNIRRVLHMTFVGPPKSDGSWKKDDAYLLRLAEEVLTQAIDAKRKTNKRINESTCSEAADWHHALMDYGSLVMKAPKPKRKSQKREPGRLVGSTFIPNRIFRGKIVEELRDAERGLTVSELGRRVCIDWEPSEHREWLEGIVRKLQSDCLIEAKKKRYMICA